MYLVVCFPWRSGLCQRHPVSHWCAPLWSLMLYASGEPPMWLYGSFCVVGWWLWVIWEECLGPWSRWLSGCALCRGCQSVVGGARSWRGHPCGPRDPRPSSDSLVGRPSFWTGWLWPGRYGSHGWVMGWASSWHGWMPGLGWPTGGQDWDQAFLLPGSWCASLQGCSYPGTVWDAFALTARKNLRYLYICFYHYSRL